MEIINTTPFPLVGYSGRIGFPGHSLTLIVKGTFDLVPDLPATPCNKQLFPTGDELYPEDDEGTGSSRYPSDFAYYKPKADLLLAGTCHAPEGNPVQALSATFQVGSRAKTIGVFGNRYWNQITRTMSDPEPFAEMMLKYENSFGGPGFKKNPTGKGAGKIKNDAGKTVWPLPNIENLNNLVDSPGKQPDPTGFGPLGSMWIQRWSKMGTYKGNWFKERWPWYPKDFDWGYFNAAPPDMQVDGYLNGDESLYFENLHPVHAAYRSRLPGIRVRLFLSVVDPAVNDGPKFHEVPLRLDTLWADMDSEKLALVWRGIVEVSSEDYEEIHHAFLITEKLEDTALSLEHYHDLFLKQIEADDIIEADEPEVEEPEIEDIEINFEEEAAKIEAEINDALKAAGVDTEAELPEPSQEDKEAEARLIKELEFEEEIPEPVLTRERIREKAAGGEGLSGLDLRAMDLSEMDFRGVDFTNALLNRTNLQKANLEDADFSGANLSNADMSRAILKKGTFKNADMTGAIISDADLSDAVLEDAILDEADLSRSKLDHCILKEVSLISANLTNASLQQSQCYAADFSKCILSNADFQEADLTEACVEKALGIGINMTGANLAGLRASGDTNFSQGIFKYVSAPYAICENAVLDQADFSHSKMEGINFASASLKNATFVGADLKFSRLSKANLFQANCVGMNLFQASLEKADLTETDFRKTSLYGAELLDATIKKTRFEQANLKMTKLAR